MNKKILFGLLTGFVIGFLWSVAIRFIAYKSDNVHYHANFALYINGQQDPFESFTFYEEVNACSSDEGGNPKHRVHMHNQENHLVHVHAEAVTWANFFESLRYGLSSNAVQTDAGVFVDGQDGNKLTFYLNGEKVETLANRVIESEDTLLINYGKEDDATLKQRFDAIPRDAGEYNGKFDPGGCGGGENLTFWNRLQKSLGF